MIGTEHLDLEERLELALREPSIFAFSRVEQIRLSSGRELQGWMNTEEPRWNHQLRAVMMALGTPIKPMPAPVADVLDALELGADQHGLTSTQLRRLALAVLALARQKEVNGE